MLKAWHGGGPSCSPKGQKTRGETPNLKEQGDLSVVTGSSGARGNKMEMGDWKVSLCWHTAPLQRCKALSPTCCTSLSSPSPPEIYSRNLQQPLPAPATKVFGGEAARLWRGHGQGRTQKMLAHPMGRKAQLKSDGEEAIRSEASPSFVHSLPLMSQTKFMPSSQRLYF